MKRSNPYKAVIPIVSGIAYVPNPKMVPHVPIEVALRSERIGSQGRDLAPGVRLISQISRTEKEAWLTHGEQRLFLYLQDAQGRGSYFYQSFAGTGGKQQGFWFPSGGIMADRSGRGAWVIKGNPKTDPGAGRAALLELYEKANAVLPQSDADTDTFVKRLTGQDYGDLTYKDAYEIKPTIRITEAGNANELQKKWGSWSYQFWALNALDKTFGKRTFNMKSNPVHLRRNSGSTLPWCDGAIDQQPRRDAPKQGNKVFWLTDRIWVEEEATELFIHSHPNRDGSWTDGESVKCRVLMLHDPDRSIKDRYGRDRDSDRPIQLEGGARRSEGDAHILVGLPGSSLHAYAMTPSPPKLYHAASRDSAEHIARRGITSGDYGHGKLVWVSLTPQRAVVAFREAHQVPRSEVDVYEIDMSGVPNVLLEHGYELSAMLEKMADFFDAPHIREMGKAAKRMAAAGGFYEDSRIIEGGVPPERVRLLPKTNPTDLAGRHIPDRYLAGLPPALQKQRIRELTESRDAYKRGDYSELPTDRTARKMGLVKQSNYTTTAKARGVEWRGNAEDMAERVLMVYSGRAPVREVAAFAEALRKSFSKGLAAWKSGGHRPGATAQNWAVARVNSLVVGGKTSWTADKKLFEVLPAAVRAKIESMR